MSGRRAQSVTVGVFCRVIRARSDEIDRFRYIVAVITIVILCSIPVFWLLVHVLTPLWRRIGPRATYVITLGIAVVVGVIVYRNRTALLGVDLVNELDPDDDCDRGVWILWQRGLSASTGSIRTLKYCWGCPSFHLLKQEKPRVMRNGFYAVMRHPRYFSGTIGLVGRNVAVELRGALCAGFDYGPARVLVDRPGGA